MSNTSTLITLGLIGVGGYLFIKEVWPMLKDQLEDFDFGLGGSSGEYGPPPEYYEPNIPKRGLQPIIEDRFPDYVIEDRYPDYVIEDRYPDYYPYPVPYPQPVYIPPALPPYCPPRKYWNGERCKSVDIDCPSGYREDDGVCKPKDCDRDEFWNGRRCEKIPDRPRPRPRPIPIPIPDRDDRDRRDRDRDNNKPRRFNTPGDKWNKEREREEIVTGKKIGPETQRAQDVIEKATQSFLEVWYA